MRVEYFVHPMGFHSTSAMPPLHKLWFIMRGWNRTKEHRLDVLVCQLNIYDCCHVYNEANRTIDRLAKKGISILDSNVWY